MQDSMNRVRILCYTYTAVDGAVRLTAGILCLMGLIHLWMLLLINIGVSFVVFMLKKRFVAQRYYTFALSSFYSVIWFGIPILYYQLTVSQSPIIREVLFAVFILTYGIIMLFMYPSEDVGAEEENAGGKKEQTGLLPDRIYKFSPQYILFDFLLRGGLMLLYQYGYISWFALIFMNIILLIVSVIETFSFGVEIDQIGVFGTVTVLCGSLAAGIMLYLLMSSWILMWRIIAAGITAILYAFYLAVLSKASGKVKDIQDHDAIIPENFFGNEHVIS